MIRVEPGVGFARITLARPGQRNALTPPMLRDLVRALTELGASARCILLEGEGSVFCAGFDLELCARSPGGGAMRELLGGLDSAIRAMRDARAPVVAACQGAAIAGGCALLGGADFVVADRGAKLGYPVVLLGVSPAVSAPTLAARMGQGAARGRLLDPGLMTGEAAHARGLVTDLVESPEEVRPAGERLASALASKPSGAMRATKRWLGELDRCALPGGEALGVSLGLAGGEEEAELLARYLGGRKG